MKELVNVWLIEQKDLIDAHRILNISLPEDLDRFLFVPVPVIGGDASCELLMSGGCCVCCVCCCCGCCGCCDCCDCCDCCCCCGLFAATCTEPGLAALSAIFALFSRPSQFNSMASLGIERSTRRVYRYFINSDHFLLSLSGVKNDPQTRSRRICFHFLLSNMRVLFFSVDYFCEIPFSRALLYFSNF